MSKTIERELTETGCKELLDHELDMVTGGIISDVLDTVVDFVSDFGGDFGPVGGTSPVTLFHERPHAGR